MLEIDLIDLNLLLSLLISLVVDGEEVNGIGAEESRSEIGKQDANTSLKTFSCDVEEEAE